MTPAMSGAVLAAAPLPLPVLPRAFIEIIRFSGRRMYGWKEAKKISAPPSRGVLGGARMPTGIGGIRDVGTVFVARLGTARRHIFV